MFCGCSSLSNLEGLENWNVSNGINFERMFDGCSSLLNLKELKNWNVSKGEKLKKIFGDMNFNRVSEIVLYWNLTDF